MASLYQMTSDLETTAQAVGISPVTIKSWMAKGHIARDLLGRLDPPPAGGGGARRSWAFGFCSVMEMAVGQAVLNVGVRSLETAFSAASSFAYLAQVDMRGGQEAVRAPALPFLEPGVRTLLFVADGHGEVIPWRPGTDPLEALTPSFSTREAEGMVMIDCGRVFGRIARALSLDQADILSAAQTGAREVALPHHTSR